jgi:hypothetical protein
VSVTISSLTPDSEGLYTVNLRGPINGSYFNTTYEVSGYQNNNLLVNPQWGAAGKYPSWSTTGEPDVFPYYGVGNTNPTSTPRTRWAQYLFVLEDGGVASNQGLLLTDFYTEPSGNLHQPEVDGFILGNVIKDDVVTVNNFNFVEAGYGRRISEAVTMTNGSRIPVQRLQVATVPSGASGSALSNFLQNPITGDTVI